jgi:L-lysine exporter family protein LysE/ArgO
MLADFWSGLATGLALIVAIGSQNAFVLRCGILRLHVLPIVAFCALSDALLIGGRHWRRRYADSRQ